MGPGDVKESSELCHWEMWIQELLPQSIESSAVLQMGTEMLPKPHQKGEGEIWTLVFDLRILKPFVGRRTELSVIYPGIIKLSWIVWRAVLIRKQKVTLDVSLSYLLRSPVSMRNVSHIKSRFSLTVQFEWQPCCNLEIHTYGSCEFFLIVVLSSICCLSG